MHCGEVGGVNGEWEVMEKRSSGGRVTFVGKREGKLDQQKKH